MTDQHSSTLQEKINQAFATVHPVGRGPYSSDEVADWSARTAAPGEPTISKDYLEKVRAGERDNPTIAWLRVLARFFALPAAYFLENGETAESIHADLQVVAAMRDAALKTVAARSTGLDPALRSWLDDMVTALPAEQVKLRAQRSGGGRRARRLRPTAAP